MTKGQTTIYK